MIALDHRVGPHLGALRNVLLTGNAHAAAVGAKAQTVIMALQYIAVELAHRERQMPVCASVFERDRFAGFGAEEHNRLAKNHAAKRLAPDLALARGDVPVIAQEHGCFSERFSGYP